MGTRKITPRRRTILNARSILQPRKLTPAQERSEIRRLARRFEGIKAVKNERPEAELPTSIADQMRADYAFRKNVLRRMNMEAKHRGVQPFGEMDAERIIDLHEAIGIMIDNTPALRRVMPEYTIGQAIRDYVKSRRFLEEINVPPAFDMLVGTMLTNHFKGKNAILMKAIQNEPHPMDGFSPIVKRMQAFDKIQFFERIRRDEKQLRRIANQQIILENELESSLKEVSSTHDLIEAADHEIHSPSLETIAQVRARVKGFDQRPKEIQERIIQEDMATRLGLTLADEIREIATLQRRLRPRHKAMFDWIIASLAHRENVRFLARKALEWYRTRRI